MRAWREDERAKMAAAGYVSIKEAALSARSSTDLVRRAVKAGAVKARTGDGTPGRQPVYVLASQWLGWVEAHRARIKARSPWL